MIIYRRQNGMRFMFSGSVVLSLIVVRITSRLHSWFSWPKLCTAMRCIRICDAELTREIGVCGGDNNLQWHAQINFSHVGNKDVACKTTTISRGLRYSPPHLNIINCERLCSASGSSLSSIERGTAAHVHIILPKTRPEKMAVVSP